MSDQTRPTDRPTTDPTRAALEALRPLSDAASPEPWVAAGDTPMLLTADEKRLAAAAVNYVRAAQPPAPPAPDEALRARIEKVLSDHGIVPNENGFHAWRCEHPDRYPGYCHCVPDLINDLLALAATLPAPSLDEALEQFDWNKVGPELEALGQAIADTIDPANPMQSNESTMDCLEHLWGAGFRIVRIPGPTPPATVAPMEGITPKEWDAFEAAVTPPAPEPSAALVVTAAEDFVRVATEHQSLDYAAPEFVILRDALRRGTSAAARAEGLDGAWAEVERVLPKGAWVNIFPPAFADPSWMAGVVLPNGPFPVSRGANPVEALHNLAAALAARQEGS